MNDATQMGDVKTLLAPCRSRSIGCSSQEGPWCSATPRCTRSSPRCRRAWRSTTSPSHTFAKLMGAFVTFWDNDAGLKIRLLAIPGQDAALIGAARQEQPPEVTDAGHLQYPHNPMKGAYDDTARNIDIDHAGYLRHSFIALPDRARAQDAPERRQHPLGQIGSVHFSRHSTV